jgi:hypothetical protein
VHLPERYERVYKGIGIPFRNTKFPTVKFYALLADGAREVRFERVAVD